MKIEIITIGDEILIGQIVDTNSAWMGRELNLRGWEVVRITTCADQADDIKAAFDDALRRADVVLVTGGTGPTKDDVTKHVLLDYFGGELVFRQDILDNVREIFSVRGLKLNALTETQAWVPSSAQVLMNRVGTAPCTWFERDGRILVSMAGVPSEMMWLMTNAVMPKLEERFAGDSAALHRTFLVKDYTESALAEHLASFEAALPDTIHLAYLPQAGIVRLRLTGRSPRADLLEAEMAGACQALRSLLGKALFADEDAPIAAVVGKRLRELGLTMATAESCTGGTIAQMITAVAGSSEYFRGGVVSYANEVKRDVLGVSEVDLESFGAVSELVVRQMVEGVTRLLGADCAVSTSGIAGPTGGTPDKPVGTVWIAARRGERTVSRLYHFGTRRDFNISKAANSALLLLLELLD